MPPPIRSRHKYEHRRIAKQAEPSALTRDAMGAFAQYQAGDLDSAWALCQALRRRAPARADVLHLQALILRGQGDLNGALASIEQAAALGPQDETIQLTHGILLQALGRPEQALAPLERAVALNGGSAAVHALLGGLHTELKQLAAAAADYRRALALSPDFVPALIGQAFCAILRGQPEQALPALERAVSNEPNHADAWCLLGNACWQLQRLDDAAHFYRTALRCNADLPDALNNLAEVLISCNEPDRALPLLEQALTSQPSLRGCIRIALLLQHVPTSLARLQHWRARFETGVADLTQLEYRSASLDTNLYRGSLFNLAYHGLDNRELLQRVAAAYRQLLPNLSYSAPHVAQPFNADSPLRIGWLTVHVKNHAVAHCFAGLLKALSTQPDFELTMISTCGQNDSGVDPVYAAFSGRWLQVPKDVADARQLIAELALDVLVYLDIGMDGLSYFLAFSRLARIQCVLTGHPDTTGIDTIDRYVSYVGAEPAGAQAQYSEKLDLLPAAVCSFRAPDVPDTFKSREALGLPAEGALYLCPMKLQKLHPDFDAAIDGILRTDPTGQVILFKDHTAPWHLALEQRFQHSVDAARRARVHFLPWITDGQDFMAVNAHASVVLDPFHFGIGSTAITIYAVGTPVVTWAGSHLRGRAGYAYCKILDLGDCIASDQQDYVTRAVRIANDGELRASLTARIQANKHRLFDNADSSDTFCDYFRALQRDLARDCAPAVACPD